MEKDERMEVESWKKEEVVVKQEEQARSCCLSRVKEASGVDCDCVLCRCLEASEDEGTATAKWSRDSLRAEIIIKKFRWICVSQQDEAEA